MKQFSLDHNECTFNHANLAKVNCGGFGQCVNFDGSYRCHCDGDVHPETGECVGELTVNDLLSLKVPKEADDGK